MQNASSVVWQTLHTSDVRTASYAWNRNEIKSRFKSQNVWYHSVQHLLSPRLVSENTEIKIDKRKMLSTVFYRCATWSLTMREKHRLCSRDRVLREMFRPKKNEVTGEWERLHNEELYDLYCSPNIIRMIKSGRTGWVRNVARVGERCIQSFRGDTWGKGNTWKT